MPEKKTVRITGKHVHASPDGLRVVHYSPGFVTEFEADVAETLVKSEQAEYAEGAQHTETQAVPAVENVAKPGETITGGEYVAVQNANVARQPVDPEKLGGAENPNLANTPVVEGDAVVNEGNTPLPTSHDAGAEGEAPEGQPYRRKQRQAGSI